PEYGLKTVERTSRNNKKSDGDRQVGAVNNGQCKRYPAEKNRQRSVPAAFSSAVGVPAIHLLGDERGHVGQRCQQCYLKIALSRDVLQNSGQPERNPITASHGTKVAR